MSSTFPLIRAAALVPFVRWMRAHGRPIDAALRAADLTVAPWDEPNRPIPFHSTLKVVRELERLEGPDIGARVVTDASLADLAEIGRLMLNAATPREALVRGAAAMPRHCTHEHLIVDQEPGGLTVRDQVTLEIDAATRHVEQQYVAALIRALCLSTGFRGEPFARIAVLPHPNAGLDHLRAHLGPNLVASGSRALSLFIPDAVLDRPLAGGGPDSSFLPDSWEILRGDRSYAGTARIFVRAMLEDGMPSVERLAAAGGLSVRTMQRRLADSGTTYSDLLDDVRRETALRTLASTAQPIGHIAADLGYSGPPAFTRAVRRWARMAPRQVRYSGGDAAGSVPGG